MNASLQKHSNLPPLHNLLEIDSDISPALKLDNDEAFVLLILGTPPGPSPLDHDYFTGVRQLFLLALLTDLKEFPLLYFEQPVFDESEVFALFLHLVLHEEDLAAVGYVGQQRLSGCRLTLSWVGSPSSQ